MHIYIKVVALLQRPLATAFETTMSPHSFKCDFNIFWNDYFHINPYICPLCLSLSLSPRMSWSRLFNREFSSLRQRISWVLGSSPTYEFEVTLRLRSWLTGCPRPFSAWDLLEILEGASEVSDKFPSPPPNIVRCCKRCTCVLMWQQISGKALRYTALAFQITRQLWSAPHFGICVIIQIVFSISCLESWPILSWRNKLARL